MGIYIFALGLFSATQFAAYQFNYDPVLGVNAHGLYPPWMILIWALKWHARYSDVFMKAGSIGSARFPAIGMVGLVMRKLLRANPPKQTNTCTDRQGGANEKDIRCAGRH